MQRIVFILSILCLTVGVGGFAARAVKAVDIATGDLIKANQAAVYYYGSDGGRYCFPNDKIFFTWYSGFSGVKTVTEAGLAAIPLRGNVTYKPGVKMVKIASAPRVYAVDRGGVLRWVASEEAASALYGADWKTEVHDIDVALFVNYKIGSNIIYASDFDRAAVTSGAINISVSMGLAGGAWLPVTPAVIPAVAPASPTINAPATVLPSTFFTLNWSAQSNATNYTVQKFSRSSFINPITVYNGPNTSASDTIWFPQYYRVRAENDAGTSAWSPIVSVGITYR